MSAYGRGRPTPRRIAGSGRPAGAAPCVVRPAALDTGEQVWGGVCIRGPCANQLILCGAGHRLVPLGRKKCFPRIPFGRKVRQRVMMSVADIAAPREATSPSDTHHTDPNPAAAACLVARGRVGLPVYGTWRNKRCPHVRLFIRLLPRVVKRLCLFQLRADPGPAVVSLE